MSDTRRFRLPFIIWILAMSFALIIEPSSAQEMKRSAGSLNRSAGTVTRSTGAEKRGASQSMRSERKSSSSDSSSFGSKKKKSTFDEEDEDDSSSSAFSEKESEEYDEEEDLSARTLGQACMYGTAGQVIYRPEGAQCRGDIPAAIHDSIDRVPPIPGQLESPVELSAQESEGASQTNASSADAAASSRVLRKVPTRQPRIGQGKPKGCIFGLDGSVMHAPAGVNCD